MFTMKKILLFFTLLSILFAGNDAFAASDKDVCFRKTAEYERREQIRPYILSTIAMVESGKVDDESALGIYPWPWTVMADGKGRFFNTKAEAVAEVKRLRQSGKNNIDVGCMQLNVGYHGDKFKSLEDMFDPDKNVAYAAGFLKKLYSETGFWGDAATRYHSKTASKAERYEIKLADAFSRIKKLILSGKKLYDEDKIQPKAKTADKTAGKTAVPKKKKTIVQNLKTPQMREKAFAARNNSLLTAAFNAKLYREQKKFEYEQKKHNSNLKKGDY